MKRIAVAILVVIALTAAAFLYLRRGYEYEISQADVQSRIETQFPVEKCVLVFCIELTEPLVGFTDGEARIEFGSNARIEVAFSSKEHDGAAGFSGVLRYVREKRAFFLGEPRLEHLEVSGVSEKDKETLNQLAALLITEYLRTNPIYSFENTALEAIAPWLELKQVSAGDGVLRIRLGLAI